MTATPQASQPTPAQPPSPEVRGGAYKWRFWSASLVILGLLVVGQIVGFKLGSWPPTQALMMALRGDAQGAGELFGRLFSAMRAADWVFSAFLVFAASYAVLQRAAILRFLRSMQAGVALIVLATVAVFAGVIVPQIENFEDPEERVNKSNYEDNYGAFAWAESYFIYHLLRPYGWRMPSADVPPGALESLERFGRVYGEEERANREKLMRASFSGMGKTEEIEAWRKAHDKGLRRAFDVVTALELNRTYKSDWFATLLFVLALSVAANTFRPGMAKKWLTMPKIGFFVTHIGILIMLGGGLVSHLLTDRGLLNLFLGEKPKDTYLRHYRTDKFSRMPFAVGLDHFARKEWKALQVHPLTEDFRSRPPRYTLWPGREMEVDFQPDAASGEMKAQMLLRVRELHEHAVVGTPTVREGEAVSAENALPVVALDAPGPVDDGHAHAAAASTGKRRALYLSPLGPNQGYFDPANRYRLAVGYGVAPESLFPSEPGTVVGTLDVEVRTDLKSQPVPVRIHLGEKVDLPGGYKVHFIDATANLNMRSMSRDKVLQSNPDPRPLEEQEYGIAAVWIDIYPPQGGEPERRLVIERVDPIEYKLQDDYAQKNVIARLRWDRWAAPGPRRYALAYGRSQKPVLVGEDGTRTEVEVGRPLELPAGGDLTPTAFLHNAVFEKNITFGPQRVGTDGWDESFYSRDPRGMVLDVVHHPGTAQETTETVVMATTSEAQSNLWFSGDERFAVEFLENTEGFPYDWRSVLSVWEPGADGELVKVDAGSPRQREIRVNDYFKYRGYRFFQTNADATMPTYSGIGVVYDPGIPVVLVGMYTIIAGTVLAFLVRPIVQSRRRREAAA